MKRTNKHDHKLPSRLSLDGAKQAKRNDNDQPPAPKNTPVEDTIIEHNGVRYRERDDIPSNALPPSRPPPPSPPERTLHAIAKSKIIAVPFDFISRRSHMMNKKPNRNSEKDDNQPRKHQNSVGKHATTAASLPTLTLKKETTPLLSKQP